MIKILLKDMCKNWAASREKVPNDLSRCHTKGRMGAAMRANPTVI